KLAKDPSKTEQLARILYDLPEALRIIAIWVSPVLPKAAHGIFDQLNWKMDLGGKEERFRLDDAEWGGLPDGHVVGKPVPLFPRIEKWVERVRRTRWHLRRQSRKTLASRKGLRDPPHCCRGWNIKSGEATRLAGRR